MKNILAIVGPTAVGKTSVAISIAKELNGEIIGLDSRQIYKGMAIGTAQPAEEEMDGIRHHLMGFREPSDPISAGEYAKLVKIKVILLVKMVQNSLRQDKQDTLHLIIK